jgi:hypothetical protein
MTLRTRSRPYGSHIGEQQIRGARCAIIALIAYFFGQAAVWFMLVH